MIRRAGERAGRLAGRTPGRTTGRAQRPPTAPGRGRRSPASEGVRSRAERRQLVARRRARVALVVASAFTAVVLVTGLPLHALLQQRADEASTTATVDRLARQNRFLANQAAALSNPTTVRALAHSEFDYILPGQKAYDVVPPAGATGSMAGVGHVQLGQPVVAPGSEASASAIGALGGPPAGSGTGTGGSSGSLAAPAAIPSSPAPGGSGGGFWARLGRTLEFWN